MESSQEPSDPLELAKHGRALRALAQSVLRDEHAADDAVQDALLHVVRTGTSEDPSLLQRLRGLVLRKARDKRRSEFARRVREERHAKGHPANSPDVESSFQSAETVTRALAAMPKASREILWLRFYEDLGPTQIAARLGLPLETVRARLRRALAALRSDVEHRLEGEGRTLQALLPLAGINLVSLGSSPALTTAGFAGGLLLMKKLILVAIAIIAGIFLVRKSADPLQVSTLDSETVVPLEPGPERLQVPDLEASRAIAALQPAPDEAPRSNAAEPLPKIEAPASEPVEMVQLRVVVRDSTAFQLVPYFTFQAQFGETTQEYRTGKEGIIQIEVPRGESVDFVWGDGVAISRMRPPERAFVYHAVSNAYEAAAIELDLSPEELAEMHLSAFSERWESERSGEIELSVAAGPTWFLDLSTAVGEPLPPLEELQAQLVYSKVGLHPAPVQELKRDDDLIWVRFPELKAWKDFDTSVLDLIVRRTDRLAEGSVEVMRREGFSPQPLEIVLEQRCGIRGQVYDDAEVVIGGVTVRAQVPGEERVFSDSTDEKGVYEMSGLEPGLWTLYVSSPRFEPFEQPISLIPGEVLERDFQLRRRVGGGTISGEITSRSGQFDGWVFLFLEGLEDTSYWKRSDPKFEDSPAGKVARFAFEDVPPGEYRLICNTNQPYGFVDRLRTLEPPATDLQFVVLDDVEPRAFTVKALAAETGELLESHSLNLIVGGGYNDVTKGTSAEPASAQVAAGSTFDWTVSSPGMKPVCGDQGDVVGEEIRVELEPGFGAWIHFLDVESLNDIEGVEVFADGVSLGKTNARGSIFATWPERPKRLHFDENEWLVHRSITYQSMINPETGSFVLGEGDATIHAYLRRAR